MRKITLEDWVRKEHFNFFSQFEEPFFGLTFTIDCTIAYDRAKNTGSSFFLSYLYRALKAANQIENFRYRIIDREVYLFNVINATPTVGRPDGTFGFSYVDYYEDENKFVTKAKEVIEVVKQSTGLKPASSGQNVIHFSAIPWVDFTSLSHARNYKFEDSCPKISFGKVTENDGRRTMPVSVHVHHGLADGFHVGIFADKFQQLMDD
ncbi:chloramphenicol O-acetyltransferase type A [Epilithonimonas lactis]|uniref:Chloramphenicol acetyltransferase n=2 Tax=Epilithonimonas lactis TaxID=421072 RepID=A0A085B6W2_9FLAO|nr:chloramphenicol acetyltransferase [Epilithonimonas lactis]KFC18207.1 chloramphenicol acetyltransferase [Epilithonimonas lactis]SER08567.1 chloramphenicol O-acetyltransferase type A [Epilithonimonas lactis]